MESWAKLSIADNTSTNHKIARLLNLCHVGCLNHLLNLDIKDWLKNDDELTKVVTVIEDVMKKSKTLKNAARLSEFTDLRPVLNNETIWSGIRLMIERFIHIRSQLIQVADDDRSDINFDRSLEFLKRCERYNKYMVQIDTVTKYLQTSKQPFELGRLAIDIMCKKIE